MAPAWHERSRYGAAPKQPGYLRELPYVGVQLPPHGRASGHWTPAARPAPTHHREATPAGSDLSENAGGRSPGCARACRAGLGSLQLAELLRAPPWRNGSTDDHATYVGPGRCVETRDHVHSS